MRNRTIYFYFFLICPFIFCCNSKKDRENTTLNEKHNEIEFLTYEDFEKMISLNSNPSDLAKAFDLLSIMLLDSSRNEILFKFDPTLKRDFHEYSHYAKINDTTVGFVTESKDLRSMFLSENSRSRIINCVRGEEEVQMENFVIENPIYIKNDIAVIRILTPISEDRYYITLKKGIVQINWLDGIIE
ncbi:hypothetical protein [Dyadobacter sp. 32]|uniref:hypothetical protein n=1 Tax=Dyadobacter sp. 32 TaxID=538966 RepID=UPI0011EC0C3F